MNIYKNLLFLHGHLHDTRFADPPRSYAEGLGNQVAARQAFPPVRGASTRQDRRAATTTPALGGCGGCA